MGYQGTATSKNKLGFKSTLGQCFWMIGMLSGILFCLACASPNPKSIVEPEYTLFLPEEATQLLLLFPCYPCDAANTNEAFLYHEAAEKNKTAVLALNFNQTLWLESSSKKELTSIVQTAIDKHGLETKNIYVGGFSSGGNMALLASNYWASTSVDWKVKGVFVVDAPIDLFALYQSSLKTIEANYSPPALEEARFLKQMLEEKFGKGDSSLHNFEKNAPFTLATNNYTNLTHLSSSKIRLYTEPDSTWWWQNRRATKSQTNAYFLKALARTLPNSFQVELIETSNKGYRPNGDRHPHSWSIVSVEDLFAWMNASSELP